MLTISIITPTLNQATFIGSTIESVLSQKGDFALEYIVMDGGSIDSQVAILLRQSRPFVQAQLRSHVRSLADERQRVRWQSSEGD